MMLAHVRVSQTCPLRMQGQNTLLELGLLPPAPEHHFMGVDAGGLQRVVPAAETPEGGQVQGPAVVLGVFRVDGPPAFAHFLDGGRDLTFAPTPVHTDLLVIQAGSFDGLTPGPEEAHSGRVNVRVVGGVVRGIDLLLGVPADDMPDYGVHCPLTVKHYIPPVKMSSVI